MIKSSSKLPVLAQGLRSALLARDVDRRAELGRLRTADRPARGRNDPLPALELVHLAPSDLKTPKRNVRAVKPSHVKEVMNAITELGFNVPVIIDDQNNIIDGVIRVRAAIELRLSMIPCIRTSARTAEEKRLLRLAANRLGEKGSWEVEALKLELQELVILEAPIEITGFESFEVDGVLTEAPDPVEPGPVEPQGDVAISRLGDMFVLGCHRILCGDARDPATLARLMGPILARVVLTDEPFNVRVSGHVTGGDHREFEMASGELNGEEFLGFNDAWIASAAAHLMEGGLLGTFIDWRGLPFVTSAAFARGLEQLNLIVWSKTNAGMGALYRSQHELLPLFKKGTAAHVNNVELGKKGRWRSNVWVYPGASTMGSDSRRGLKSHPTVKPVAMLTDAMLDLTHRDEVVLDPFLGSGSTLIAAEQCGRVCRGVELDPLYVDVILRRYQEVTGKPAVLEASGETFDQLAAGRALESVPAERQVAVAQPASTGTRPGRSRPGRQMQQVA